MKRYALSKVEEYACIIIGDEILEGHVVEGNLLPLIKALSEKGYSLKETRFVSDDLDDIVQALDELKQKYTFVVTTGGIGPTHDDRTFEAYAKSFNTKTILHEEMLKYFLKKNSQRDKNQLKAITQMCTMPAEIELIYIDEKWPLLKLENCFIMPGLPSVCHQTIEKLAHIIPTQGKKFYAGWYLSVKEHNYFEWLRALAHRYANTIKLGSYPIDIDSELKNKGINSKISLISSSNSEALKCVEEIKKFVEQQGWLIKTTDLAQIQ